MEDKIRVLLSEEEVNARINEVAAQINADYAGKPIPFNLHFERRRVFYL